MGTSGSVQEAVSLSGLTTKLGTRVEQHGHVCDRVDLSCVLWAGNGEKCSATYLVMSNRRSGFGVLRQKLDIVSQRLHEAEGSLDGDEHPL